MYSIPNKGSNNIFHFIDNGIKTALNKYWGTDLKTDMLRFQACKRSRYFCRIYWQDWESRWVLKIEAPKILEITVQCLAIECSVQYRYNMEIYLAIVKIEELFQLISALKLHNIYSVLIGKFEYLCLSKSHKTSDHQQRENVQCLNSLSFAFEPWSKRANAEVVLTLCNDPIFDHTNLPRII